METKIKVSEGITPFLCQWKFIWTVWTNNNLDKLFYKRISAYLEYDKTFFIPLRHLQTNYCANIFLCRKDIVKFIRKTFKFPFLISLIYLSNGSLAIVCTPFCILGSSLCPLCHLHWKLYKLCFDLICCF